MNRYVAGLLLITMPFCFSSCSTKLFGKKKHKNKDAVAALPAADTVKTVAVLSAAPVQKANNPAEAAETPAAKAKLMSDLAPLWAKRLAYRTFTGKARTNFEGPGGSNELTATIRIKKDSVIWVHVTALGGVVSAARILVTQDSFFMVNYLQKQVTKLALKDAGKMLPTPVDFQQLQNLVIGEPLRGGAITDATALPTALQLMAQDSSYMQQITYQKADSNMAESRMTTVKPGGPLAIIEYYNYKATGGRKFSTKREIHVENGDKKYSIDMDFSNVEFDKALEYPFSFPKNYELKNPK